MPALTDEDGEQLRRAARIEDVNYVEELIAQGVNINAHNQRGDTALHLAAGNGNDEVAEILINEHAQLEMKNQNGQTPLHLAALRGHTEVVKLLSSRKHDLNLTTKYSEMTALHLASKEGHAEICRILLQADGIERETLDCIKKNAEFYAPDEETKEVFRQHKPYDGKIYDYSDHDIQNTIINVLRSSGQSNGEQLTGVDVTPAQQKNMMESPSLTDEPMTEDKPTRKTATEELDEKSSTEKQDRSQSEASEKRKQAPGPQEGTEKKERSKSHERGKKSWDNLKGKNAFQKSNDHEFEWSREFKQRQQLSVFDRLMGGKR